MDANTRLSLAAEEKSRFETGVSRELVGHATPMIQPIKDFANALFTGDDDFLARVYGPALEDSRNRTRETTARFRDLLPRGGEANLAVANAELSGERERQALLAGAPLQGINMQTQLMSLLLGQGGTFGNVGTGSLNTSMTGQKSILDAEARRRSANFGLITGIASAGASFGSGLATQLFKPKTTGTTN